MGVGRRVGGVYEYGAPLIIPTHLLPLRVLGPGLHTLAVVAVGCGCDASDTHPICSTSIVAHPLHL